MPTFQTCVYPPEAYYIYIFFYLGAGYFEHGNEPSGSIKGEEYLECLSDY
jgi:hypothetical protein